MLLQNIKNNHRPTGNYLPNSKAESFLRRFTRPDAQRQDRQRSVSLDGTKKNGANQIEENKGGEQRIVEEGIIKEEVVI